MTPTITGIVIAKNEEALLANCLDTLRWCDEVIVIDNNSQDATVGIANQAGARVHSMDGTFAELRNEGLRRSKTDWVLYVDADERVTPALAQELRLTTELALHQAFAVNRNNVHYGHYLEHGGWGDDWVVRLFQREHLAQWAGDVHEHAEVTGTTGKLKEKLVHFSHRDIISGLLKTAHWTPIEAQLLAQSKSTPKVGVGLIIRKMLMEIIRRGILKRGYKDGQAGWIETLIQGMNRMLVYMQVWELQQKPNITDRYEQYEKSIMKLWQQAK